MKLKFSGVKIIAVALTVAMLFQVFSVSVYAYENFAESESFSDFDEFSYQADDPAYVQEDLPTQDFEYQEPIQYFEEPAPVPAPVIEYPTENIEQQEECTVYEDDFGLYADENILDDGEFPDVILPDVSKAYTLKDTALPPKSIQKSGMLKAAAALATPAISATNVTASSFTISVTFPDNSAWGNYLSVYDWTKGERKYYVAPNWVASNDYDKPCKSGSYTFTNIEKGRAYEFTLAYCQNNVWTYKEIRVWAPFDTPKITVSNVAMQSASFSVVFPCPTSDNNYVYFYDLDTWQSYAWDGDIPRLGDTPPKRNGTYNVTDLVPNTRYKVRLAYYRDDINEWQETVQTFKTTAYTGSNVIKNTGGKVVFDVPGYMSGKINSTLINNADSAFNLMKDLVGSDSPFGNSFNVTTIRNLGRLTTGDVIVAISGNPIRYEEGFLNEHLLFLSKYNNTIIRTLLHEMGHNFDKSKWNFESEFFAELKAAYVLENSNLTFTQGRLTYQGNNIKNFYKSHPVYGYDDTVAKGTYNCWGLTYNFLKIKDVIGWNAFKQTFRYFDSLAEQSIPTTNIGKLNLFLTKLRDFSPNKTDVIAMFTAQEKSVYQTKFGGTMAYYTGTLLQDDHSNSIWSSTQLTLNVPMNGQINYAGDSDCFKFTPSATGRYILESTGVPLKVENPWKRIPDYATYFPPIFTDNSKNFKHVYELEAGEEYLFEIKHVDSSISSGNYTIIIKKDDETVDDYYNDIWNATFITLGNSISGRIHYPGDIDCFKFTAPETGLYIFEGIGAPLNAKCFEFYPNGSAVSANEVEQKGNFKNMYYFEKNVTYAFKVSHQDKNAISGFYTLKLKTLSEELVEYRTTLGGIGNLILHGNTNIVFRSIQINIPLIIFESMLINQHYENNKNYFVENGNLYPWYIEDQYDEPSSNIQMGLKSPNPDDSNACGWVAAFNALHSLNYHVHPSDIVKYLESNDGLFVDGLLGVNPTIYKNFFANYGYETNTTLLPTNNDPIDYDKLAKSGKTSILCYFNANSITAHYINVTWNPTTNLYVAHNAKKAETYIPSLNNYIKNETGGFIALIVVK